MAKEKICPMPNMPRDCMKKECAWWDKITGLCAVLNLSRFGSEGSFYRQRQEQKESINRARGG